MAYAFIGDKVNTCYFSLNLSDNESFLPSLEEIGDQMEKIKQNRRVDQVTYTVFLLLYITIIVVGGGGNLVILIACINNKVPGENWSVLQSLKLSLSLSCGR